METMIHPNDFKCPCCKVPLNKEIFGTDLLVCYDARECFYKVVVDSVSFCARKGRRRRRRSDRM